MVFEDDRLEATWRRTEALAHATREAMRALVAGRTVSRWTDRYWVPVWLVDGAGEPRSTVLEVARERVVRTRRSWTSST